MAKNKLFGMLNPGGDMNLGGISPIPKPKKMKMPKIKKGKAIKPIKPKKPKGLKGF